MDTTRLHPRIGHYSHPGRQRELNEDSYLILIAPEVAPGIDFLFAIADGMGGHRAGDVASRTLVEIFEQQFTSLAYQEQVACNQQRTDYYVVALDRLLQYANEKLFNLAASRPELSGMGTTATVVLLAHAHLFWGHVGDSRFYLLREGKLQQLTCDHNWVAEQVEAGLITLEEAAYHPQQNVLTRSLGNLATLEADCGMLPAQPDDVVLLCSDGLNKVVNDTEIRDFLTVESNLQHACECLVTLANQRGGPDNVTVLGARLAAGDPEVDYARRRILGPLTRQTADVVDDTVRLKGN
ncbi:MAG: Stp1/IreP family PP2C-type Ser/Thr phosphatase [Anaerolineae bacterium]|nr:Stp1/IreP family PP2C-type Ser/Thr phosphatase [Anaerolineae bacterium]